jgi:hypothetical protein
MMADLLVMVCIRQEAITSSTSGAGAAIASPPRATGGTAAGPEGIRSPRPPLSAEKERYCLRLRCLTWLGWIPHGFHV